MDPLPCPLCGEDLDPIKRQHGLVWVCRVCRAGAVTLPVLRQVAERSFVNQLWQTALHGGRPSKLACPSCSQPFTEYRGANAAMSAQLKVCVRCFWVWLRPGAFLSSSIPEPPPPSLGTGRAFTQGTTRAQALAEGNACHALSTLAVGVLRRML